MYICVLQNRFHVPFFLWLANTANNIIVGQASGIVILLPPTDQPTVWAYLWPPSLGLDF